jgi:hypothetical protein
MSWKPKEFTVTLSGAVDAYDRSQVGELCEKLIRHLRTTETAYDQGEAGTILDLLRKKRYFDAMQCVADVLIQTGQDSWKIRRQYAQSQLDLGNITAAIATLERLVTDTAVPRRRSMPRGDGDGTGGDKSRERENAEARGLLGRAYKQLYVDADSADVARNRQNLERAIKQYRDVYTGNTKKWLWHGINSVALIQRAVQDQVELADIAGLELMAKSMATEILATIVDLKISGEAKQWDFATAVEACVALGRHEEALSWLALYLGNYTTDAFELASTHRQLAEVWRLSPQAPPGDRILPLLKAALLKAAGGEIAITPGDAHGPVATAEEEKGLEKILGDTGLKTLKWLQRGMDRARAVARVRKKLDGRPFGTGFLLRGEDLVPGLGEALVFLTNAHVVSELPERGALQPTDALLDFELVGSSGEGMILGTVLRSSPFQELDYTLLTIQNRQMNVEPIPLARARPSVDGKQRAYVIGHPQGRDLELSLQDNFILDADDRFVHYRSPTEPGSSGSPVFNEEWACIGLHHAGKHTMPRLHGEGTYPANEGIWLEAIIRDMRSAPLR